MEYRVKTSDNKIAYCKEIDKVFVNLDSGEIISDFIILSELDFRELDIYRDKIKNCKLPEIKPEIGITETKGKDNFV